MEKQGMIIQSEYNNISERLRLELESRIEILHLRNCFSGYVNIKVASFGNADKSDLLCSYLLCRAPKDYVLSGRLLQGIRTWFNMYYDDRLSVIDKFRTCCQNAQPHKDINESRVVTIAFCKFLINELLGILAESRWQSLINYDY